MIWSAIPQAMGRNQGANDRKTYEARGLTVSGGSNAGIEAGGTECFIGNHNLGGR
jgi:hypothetical protein